MKKRYVSLIVFSFVFHFGMLGGGTLVALNMSVVKIGHLSDTHLCDSLGQWFKDTFPQFKDGESWTIEFDKDNNPHPSTRSFIVPIHTTIGRWREWREKWKEKIRVEYDVSKNISIASSQGAAVESIYRLLQEEEIVKWTWPDIVSETGGRFVYCFSSKALMKMEQEAPSDFPVFLIFLLDNAPFCESVNDSNP